MRKKLYAIFMITGMTLAMTACGQKSQGTNESPSATEQVVTTVAENDQEITQGGDDTEKETKEETKEEKDEKEEGATWDQLSGMLGMSDQESESLFGGGIKNQTEDQTILIGRNYQTSLFDYPAEIHTMYDENQTIYLVQAELDGMSVSDCQAEITNAVGVQMLPVDKGESGQHSGQWSYDGKQVNLYHTEGTLFIELFVPTE